jgi:hypothetical protein
MKSPHILIHSRAGIEAARERLARDRGAPTSPPKDRGGLSYFLRDESGSGPNILAPKAYRPPKDADIEAASHDLVTVGIWSLDAWLGDLEKMIAVLNRTQDTFIFYEVQAIVPAGLISRPERMIPWLTEGLGESLDESLQSQIVDNVVANDFFAVAEGIRKDLGLDYMVGITPSMVAGIEDDEYYWNHFSTFDEHTALASSYDLHEFARETGRPFEAFLVKVICSQLLVAMFFPKLSFHDDNGCMFDYDAARETLKEKVLKPRIEDACLRKIPKKYRDAAVALTDLSKKPAEFWS